LIDTLDFLKEQSSIMAFSGEILGVIPFRDRWIGRTQSLDSRDTIAAMREVAGIIPVLPSIRESEQFKRAIRTGKLLSDINHSDLQYTFEQIILALDL
jgi:chromosome partitioning protein